MSHRSRMGHGGDADFVRRGGRITCTYWPASPTGCRRRKRRWACTGRMDAYVFFSGWRPDYWQILPDTAFLTTSATAQRPPRCYFGTKEAISAMSSTHDEHHALRRYAMIDPLVG